MKISNWFIIALLCAVGLWVASSNAATLTGQNYPYWIFNDNGVERWCEDPPAGATTAICWSAGESKECKMLKPEDGFIDCKD